MDCTEFRKSVSREHDGEECTSGREGLGRHLDSCPGCRGFLESVSLVSSIHRSIPGVDPPERLSGLILSAIEDDRRAGIGGWRGIAVSAAAALIILLGMKTGGYIVSVFAGDRDVQTVRGPEMEYLGPYPPDSLGRMLIASAEGESDE